ncbi:hypothetical protein GOODEAATRI_005576 [Goodea atripinnis]|uniref:adenylate cyclase n=1 Tax=Goodea atripinnis TaxID=208336 RepID=A0ABV0PVT0_9TELE
MRTAPQKLRNRSNANQANMIQSSPRTRVNRYIGRLIEARQTESDTADLNFLTLMYKCAEREQRIRTALCILIVLLIYAVAQACVVGCMPWMWGSANTNSSIVIIDVDSGENRTMAELPCDGARYAFLSCVVGTLTLALFLRVSWLPKMALMLLLGVLYITVLELSGFHKTAGGGSFHIRGYEPILSLLLFVSALALHSRQLDLKLRLDFLWAVQVWNSVLDNRRILFNLLPAHVAQHFLMSNPRNMLMDKECYKDIEKIKTIGSTYMAAVGLVPTIGTKVTEEVYRMLNTNYDLVCRGKVSVKGKGEMLTYFLEGKVQGIGTATTSSVMRSTSLARRIHSCGKASVPTHLDSVSSATSLAPQAGMGGNFQMDTANISNNQATCLLSPCVPALGELEGEDDVEVTKIQIEAVPAIADVAM